MCGAVVKSVQKAKRLLIVYDNGEGQEEIKKVDIPERVWAPGSTQTAATVNAGRSANPGRGDIVVTASDGSRVTLANAFEYVEPEPEPEPEPKPQPAHTGGVLGQIARIRSMLNIATPAIQIVNVVNEANVIMGRPVWTPASGGSIPVQIAQLLSFEMLGFSE